MSRAISIQLSGLFLCLTLGLFAQNESDVLLYTSHEYGGTARYTAMGSSFGGLGGDLSSLSTNPAGLGLYRSGEFTISPTFLSSNSSSTFYEGSADESDFDFTIGNLGYARAFEANHDKWKYAQFGFAFNRLRDFHDDHVITGRHDQSSLLDYVAGQARGVHEDGLSEFDPFFVSPAYFAFLIDPFVDSLGMPYYDDVIADSTSIDQRIEISNRGRVSESVFAFSGNYDDRLYLGVAMAFQRAVRDEISRFSETVVDTAMSELDYFEVNQDLEIRGDAINFKFGAIFRASDNVRIGASYVTPTWYTFNNTWSTDWYSEFDNGDTYTEVSEPIGSNQYNLRTPSRLTGSLGIVIAKQALFNLEYEHLNYAGAKFDRSGDSDIDFTRENNEIVRQYISVGNVRAGMEYRYKTLSFRAGYGYYPSPFEEGLTLSSADKQVYSGGIGYRKDKFNFDLSYRVTQFQTEYYPYDPSMVQAADISVNNHTISTTVGFRF